MRISLLMCLIPSHKYEENTGLKLRQLQDLGIFSNFSKTNVNKGSFNSFAFKVTYIKVFIKLKLVI